MLSRFPDLVFGLEVEIKDKVPCESLKRRFLDITQVAFSVGQETE